MKFNQNSSPILWPSTQTQLQPGELIYIPEAAILNILQVEWWVRIEEWFISRRLILEQKTNHWVIQPPPSISSRGFVWSPIKDTRHSTAAGFADTLKVILSFDSCQGPAHFMHSFWALDPHIPAGRRSWHLNKRKRGPVASQRSRLWASHILTKCRLHSPGHFY